MRRMTLAGTKASRSRLRTGGLAATGIAATLGLTGSTIDPQTLALLDGLLDRDGTDTVGNPVPEADLDDAQRGILEKLAWETVSKYAYSGVKVPAASRN